MTSRGGGQERHSANFVQVSRLGQPLVNEVVIPRRLKDTFNAIEPTSDGAALPYVLDPEVPKLLSALFGIQSPPRAAQRPGHDLPHRHSRPEQGRRWHALRRCCV